MYTAAAVFFLCFTLLCAQQDSDDEYDKYLNSISSPIFSTYYDEDYVDFHCSNFSNKNSSLYALVVRSNFRGLIYMSLVNGLDQFYRCYKNFSFLNEEMTFSCINIIKKDNFQEYVWNDYMKKMDIGPTHYKDHDKEMNGLCYIMAAFNNTDKNDDENRIPVTYLKLVIVFAVILTFLLIVYISLIFVFKRMRINHGRAIRSPPIIYNSGRKDSFDLHKSRLSIKTADDKISEATVEINADYNDMTRLIDDENSSHTTFK